MNRYIIVLEDGIREIESEDIPSIVYTIDDIDWRDVIAIFKSN